jgi:hypothetical protein
MYHHDHREYPDKQEPEMRVLIELSGELLKAILSVILLGGSSNKDKPNNKADD